MNKSSFAAFRTLKGRLILLSVGILALALVVAWFALSNLFEKHVEARIQSELTNHLNQLILSIKEDKPGKLSLKKPLSDPRFNQPFSGLYWQVTSKDGGLLKSRSLWDYKLDISKKVKNINGLQEYSIEGPDNSELFSMVQYVSLDAGSGEKFFLMIVSLDHREITKAVDNFSYDLALALGALAIILLITVLIQVFVGLAPLRKIKTELAQLQSGDRQNLDNSYPNEVLPVIKQINNFIKSQEIAAERGRARASDLAHGFKTPLSILTAEARKLESQGNTKSTQVLRQQIATMKQHVERELARAKLQSIQPQTSQKTNIRETIEKLVTTLDRLTDDHKTNWVIDIPSQLSAQIETGDFIEVCGNLLENAQKWSKSTIAISARKIRDDRVILEIEDDGPGVKDNQLEEILQRGKRLDETTNGTGLGLAIANDIMLAYNYSLEPYHAKQGGLGMRLFMTIKD